MKTFVTLFALVVLANLAYGQKKNIDYQFFRDTKQYYAFELFKNADSEKTGELMLNFTTNDSFTKIEKILIKAGAVEVKLKFKQRAEAVKSDNPEQKFYPVIFSEKEITDKNLGCEAQIVFKLDNGLSYTLPFNACLLK
ncbi:hypothetical protein ACS5PU_06010 [Pedobacter sp. GSP4]|uniref:hypothetical protein n=1 Tax=Pedobacter sp. GSP4 TaxID=3453716 RepID=UPI003EEA1984